MDSITAAAKLLYRLAMKTLRKAKKVPRTWGFGMVELRLYGTRESGSWCLVLILIITSLMSGAVCTGAACVHWTSSSLSMSGGGRQSEVFMWRHGHQHLHLHLGTRPSSLTTTRYHWPLLGFTLSQPTRHTI